MLDSVVWSKAYIIFKVIKINKSNALLNEYFKGVEYERNKEN